MNSKKTKSFILAAVTAVLFAIALLALGVETIVLIIIVAIAAIAGVLIGFLIFKDAIIKDIKTELQADENNSDPSNEAIESLIALEERLALDELPLNDSIRSTIDTIIENLIDIVPKINDEYTSQTITFEVTNMAQEHFPNRVTSYLHLSVDDRSSQESKLVSDLKQMEDVIIRVNKVITSDALNKDERESLLNDIKYGGF